MIDIISKLLCSLVEFLRISFEESHHMIFMLGSLHFRFSILLLLCSIWKLAHCFRECEVGFYMFSILFIFTFKRFFIAPLISTKLVANFYVLKFCCCWLQVQQHFWYFPSVPKELFFDFLKPIDSWLFDFGFQPIEKIFVTEDSEFQKCSSHIKKVLHVIYCCRCR